MEANSSSIIQNLTGQWFCFCLVSSSSSSSSSLVHLNSNYVGVGGMKIIVSTNSLKLVNSINPCKKNKVSKFYAGCPSSVTTFKQRRSKMKFKTIIIVFLLAWKKYHEAARLSGSQGMTMDWQRAPASPSSYTVKRILRLEIPVDNYPNEEKLRGRPGYEHLSEPLHILIEADLPANIVDIRLRQAQEIIEELLKPVDESQDYIKRQQLRELAMPNSNFRESNPDCVG